MSFYLFSFVLVLSFGMGRSFISLYVQVRLSVCPVTLNKSTSQSVDLSFCLSFVC